MTPTLPPAVLTACAASVAPDTVAAVIRVESGGNPLAVNINNGPSVDPQTLTDAVKLASAAIAQGYKVDVGLMQVDSENFAALGVTLPEMFNPCANIEAGAAILTADYLAALQHAAPGLPALKLALSAYNTGDFERGFQNGYVAKYFSGASNAPIIPAVVLTPYDAPPQVYARKQAPGADQIAESDPYTAPMQVYERSLSNDHFAPTKTASALK